MGPRLKGKRSGTDDRSLWDRQGFIPRPLILKAIHLNANVKILIIIYKYICLKTVKIRCFLLVNTIICNTPLFEIGEYLFEGLFINKQFNFK